MADGRHWTVMSGDTSGETYEELKTDVEDYFVWDHPFDIHYKAKNIRGWPKIFVEVWSVSNDRYSLAGYG